MRQAIERVLSSEKPIFKHKGIFTPEISTKICLMLEQQVLGKLCELFITNKVVQYGAIDCITPVIEHNHWEFSIKSYSGWDRDVEHTDVFKIINPHDFKLYERGFIVAKADAILWKEEKYLFTEIPFLAFLNLQY